METISNVQCSSWRRLIYLPRKSLNWFNICAPQSLINRCKNWFQGNRRKLWAVCRGNGKKQSWIEMNSRFYTIQWKKIRNKNKKRCWRISENPSFKEIKQFQLNLGLNKMTKIMLLFYLKNDNFHWLPYQSESWIFSAE